MINVNQITAKLATLPDQALQQYAMMNKNDPYIMSLAMSESTRRQEIRSAAQGAQGGMQQPPKVVDQVVAQMAPQPMPQQPLPEDVGIGQLPAGDMEMAGGGIVSFAEGGDEGRVIPGARQPQYGSGVAFGGSVENWRRMLEGQQPDYTPPPPVTMSDAEIKEYQRKKELGGFGLALEWLQNKFDVDANNARIIAEGTEKRLGLTPEKAAEARTQFAQTDPRRVIPEVATETEGAAGAAGAAGAEGTSAARSMGPAAPSFVPGPTGISQTTGLESLPTSQAGYAKMFGADALDSGIAGLTSEAKKIGQAGVEGAKKTLASFDKDITELGEYGVEREAKLNKQLKELEGKEDKNVSMALLEAGLAMMAGTSANAFENIGKGALVGTKAYKEGVERIDAKREKLDEALSNLMDVRRGEKVVNKKERRALERDVANAEQDAAKTLFTVGKDALGMTQELAKASTTAYVNTTLAGAKIASDKETTAAQIAAGDRRTEAQIASAERIAAMPSKEQSMYEALGGGDLKKGMEVAAQIKAGKFDVRSAYSKYLEAFAGKTTLEKPMDFASFAGMFALSSAPSTGPVRQLK